MKEKENGSKKTIFSIIIGFIFGLFTFILPKLCNFRKSADENRDRVEECQDRADKQQSDNREQQSNNSATVAGIEGAIGIIQEIRTKQQITEENSNRG